MHPSVPSGHFCPILERKREMRDLTFYDAKVLILVTQRMTDIEIVNPFSLSCRAELSACAVMGE